MDVLSYTILTTGENAARSAPMTKSKIALRVAQVKNTIIRKDLTLRAVAELADVPYPTIQPLHRDDWNPTLKTLIKIEGAVMGGARKEKNG